MKEHQDSSPQADSAISQGQPPARHSRPLPKGQPLDESKAGPLTSSRLVSYDDGRKEQQQPGMGTLPQKSAAAAEITKVRKITPKYAERRSVSVFLPDGIADDLSAIAASQGMGLTDYASSLLAQHVAANPQLVEEGKARLETGWRAPYRTRRMELESQLATPKS